MKDSVDVAAVGSMGSDMPLILTHEMFQYERAAPFQEYVPHVPVVQRPRDRAIVVCRRVLFALCVLSVSVFVYGMRSGVKALEELE
jgi:hypothetical protein